MLNIVVPMAGRGSRFMQAGYSLPKPLIKIHNMSLIECVALNLTPTVEHRFIFLCLEEHLLEYALASKLRSISPGCEIVTVNRVTEGAACTVLLAKEFINNRDMLMIANSDQYVSVDIDGYIASIGENDGLIMTMKASHPKWSYIKHDEDGLVTCLREKEVISHEATVGIYNYRHGESFVSFAEQMIAKNIRVNGEFYVAPVYNELIEAGQRIGYYNVGAEYDGMYGLGTPEDLDIFRELDVSKPF